MKFLYGFFEKIFFSCKASSKLRRNAGTWEDAVGGVFSHVLRRCFAISTYPEKKIPALTFSENACITLTFYVEFNFNSGLCRKKQNTNPRDPLKSVLFVTFLPILGITLCTDLPSLVVI